jgi:NAD(P)-dependent dehydrogenase (short-subunit alcohol dehydrogenase family)
MEMNMAKRILITGANGGFGKLMFDTLAAKGHKVVAAMRDTGGRNKNAADQFKKTGEVVEIDVTVDSSVKSGVAQAIQVAGGLDVVINNAGTGVIGLQEAFTPEDLKKIFDINVFGVHRMNRAVLPHMRKNRSGLLVHISSLLGRITVPFYGPYNASKWALEALAENYRSELSGFGSPGSKPGPESAKCSRCSSWCNRHRTRFTAIQNSG